MIGRTGSKLVLKEIKHVGLAPQDLIETHYAVFYTINVMLEVIKTINTAYTFISYWVFTEAPQQYVLTFTIPPVNVLD